MLKSRTAEGPPGEPDLIILFADDHQLIREAVKPYLRTLGANVRILEAASYEEVLTWGGPQQDPGNRPHLVLLDLSMPGCSDTDPMAALRTVVQALPDTKLVVFSGSDDTATIAAALKTGARGYVPKTVQGRSLVAALRLVLDGEIYVPVEAMRSAMQVPKPVEVPAAPPDVISFLTRQELTSLGLLVKGMSNKQIARVMTLQEVTVKMHLRNAYRKIGASNRIDAVRIALEHGVGRLVRASDIPPALPHDPADQGDDEDDGDLIP